ncbi:AbrB/MazE/SpoVT family DNA-binding domain-containing protein [Candidatus Daviesbacteria bacterium]|nr:AbrB/MazE/SpoVT family DNA-binding domain-containing protein [Candidatus Daviesbacteria bacterium]
MGKVFKNGNSIAVTIPKVYAHQLNIRPGSPVEWKKSSSGLTLVPEKTLKPSTEIDPEVARLIKKISTKYTQVWQDLAKL